MGQNQGQRVRRTVRGRYATAMLALLLDNDLCQTLSRWPQPDGWTGVGFVATVAGLLVGLLALWFTWRIYSWTNASDDERHAQLTFALEELKRAYTSPTTPASEPDADLIDLPADAPDKVRALLDPGERIIRIAKPGTGKGNRPWLAMTTTGRVFRVYRGGRRGGVHASVLY